MKQTQLGQSPTISRNNQNLNYNNSYNSFRQNFKMRTRNLKLDLGIPYPTHTIKQKLFHKPRPARPYERFIPTKIALSGVDPSGNINEFVSNDIINPLKRPNLYYKTFTIPNEKSMNRFIDLFKKRYDSAEKYYEAVGLTSRYAEMIRNKLI